MLKKLNFLIKTAIFTAISIFILTCFMDRMLFSYDSNETLINGIASLQKAYNEWDENEFQQSLLIFKEARGSFSNEGLAEYWCGTAYFFLSLHNLFSPGEKPDKTKGVENAKKGIEILTKSIELMPDFSESYAMRGVLRGILIKMKPFSVFTQGPKVGKDRDKALSLDEDNPRVHYLTGVSFWFAPEILGGPEKAMEHLLRAEILFEKEQQTKKDKILPTWGQSTCLAFMGDIYMSQNQKDKAVNYYKKALNANPEDLLALKGLKKAEGRGYSDSD